MAVGLITRQASGSLSVVWVSPLARLIDAFSLDVRTELGLGRQGKLLETSFYFYFSKLLPISVFDYKTLPLAGAQVVEDMTNVASYSYNPTLKELISYDTPNIVKTKTQYIVANGMAVSLRGWQVT